jgi:hypothetical protein
MLRPLNALRRPSAPLLPNERLRPNVPRRGVARPSALLALIADVVLALRNLGLAPLCGTLAPPRPGSGLRAPRKFILGAILGAEYRAVLVPRPEAEPPLLRCPDSRSRGSRWEVARPP